VKAMMFTVCCRHWSEAAWFCDDTNRQFSG